jgi:sugar phosphate isomerase/epimerase
MSTDMAGKSGLSPDRALPPPAFGLMNSPLLPLPEELERIAASGFDFLELALDAPASDHHRALKHKPRLQTLLAAAGMGLLCHLPTFLYTADPCDAVRQASILEMRRSFEAAAALGADKVVMHPSPFSGLAPAMRGATLERCRENLEWACDRATELGLQLCLENMFPGYRAFFHPNDFDELLAAHPGLMLTLDVGHANLGSEACGAAAFLDRFPDRIGHLHFSDNGGTRDDHLPLGKGAIDFGSILDRLVRSGYKQGITLEIFSGDAADLEQSRQRMVDGWQAAVKRQGEGTGKRKA